MSAQAREGFNGEQIDCPLYAAANDGSETVAPSVVKALLEGEREREGYGTALWAAAIKGR